MKVYRSLEEVPQLHKPVITQGTFDGVHRGHRKVLKSVTDTSASVGGESMLITFYPHPRLVLYPDDSSLRLLSTIEEKTHLVEAAGIDHMLVLPFTDEVAKLSPLDFVRNVLVEKLNVHTMIVGYDHRFGRNREGSFEDLLNFGEMFGFQVLEIPASEIEAIAVSSTRIRKSLSEGDLELANELLGHFYGIEGTVVHGKKLGRTIGYPTANIQSSEAFKLIPAEGVYAALCTVDGITYKGAANIGQNPTISGKGFSMEVYLFHFDQDIYEKHVELKLVRFLREERRFESIEALREQIEKDVHAAEAALMAF